ENNPDYKLKLEKELRDKIFPGQVLRTKEGEVVTEEQIRAYEKAMREKGVGTGSLPTDATPPAAPEPKAAAKESSEAKQGASAAAAKKAAAKAVPEELF
ncbi:MAG: recombinase RecA, partial [Treponema sp.]|nr:recombinase RecA [Treponema sp.]